MAAYTAAKHGVAGLTKALANEWAAKNIHVNAIAPGYFDTEMCAAIIRDPCASRKSEAASADVGAGPRDSSVRCCFSPATPATTWTATCWWLTAAGWEGRRRDWGLEVIG